MLHARTVGGAVPKGNHITHAALIRPLDRLNSERMLLLLRTATLFNQAASFEPPSGLSGT